MILEFIETDNSVLSVSQTVKQATRKKWERNSGGKKRESESSITCYNGREQLNKANER